jgi:hypothetical protein
MHGTCMHGNFKPSKKSRIGSTATRVPDAVRPGCHSIECPVIRGLSHDAAPRGVDRTETENLVSIRVGAFKVVGR